MAFAVGLLVSRADALPPQPSVTGVGVGEVDSAMGSHDRPLGLQGVAWSALATTTVQTGIRWLTFPVSAGAEAVWIPPCAGRKYVFVDDHSQAPSSAGPLVVDLPQDGQAHRVWIRLEVSAYEHRVACGSPPRVGVRATTELDFDSPHRAQGGGHAVVYVPPGHDSHRPGALLVGLHPWNGGIWTYAAYAALLDAARAADVVLLFPSGLSNSLYTADAEDEVLRALAAFEHELPIDPDRVTLFGASMGGAGATTIGFHHPDLFATVVSLFGDSKYDLSTYVRSILHDAAGAHRVNALDIVDNARNLPVWLIHGTDDHTSPIAQSAMLARALQAMGFAVTFNEVPGAGHEGVVVTSFAERIVGMAATARRVRSPMRVSYWSVRPGDDTAYGIRLSRLRPTGDAFFDLSRVAGSVHLVRAEGVRSLTLPRGAFATGPTETLEIVHDDPLSRDVAVTWDAAP